jgi:two-component sensor histidine kinase
MAEIVTNTNRFKKVMYLAFGLGIITNIYITAVLIHLSAGYVLLSPLIGTLVFILTIIFASKNILDITTVYFIAAYSIAIEVSVHTYYLGWDTGFFYFLFLLPLTYLLYSEWRISTTVIYNGSSVLLTYFLWYFLHDKKGIISMDAELASFLNQFNLGMVALVVMITMIYYSLNNKIQDKKLINANRELEQQNKEISEQHKSVQILLKEVHHRVKNNLQIISSLMSMQRRSVRDSEAMNILDESRRRVEAIATIHQKLYQGKEGSQVDFKSYLEDIVQSQQVVQSEVSCTLKSIQLSLNLDIAVPLGLIISELITNSVKHAFQGIKSPKLSITLIEEDNVYILTFQDNGIGLPSDFTLVNPTSLGTEIISALIEQLEADITYESRDGAWFKICFQKHE